MFSYNVKLAIKSMRRNPMMTALMVAAIAVGIGIRMTTLSVYYMMNGNPIPAKSDDLFAVTLDSWSPIRPFDDDRPERAPHQLTYQDAERLVELAAGKRQAAMFESSLIIEPANDEEMPFEATARVTTGDFFAMFNVPFIYGDGWDKSANEEPMVVLTRQLNERLFGGEDSIGRWVTMNSTRFQVAGVTDTWEPTPRFYDPINGGFQEVNEMFIPFGLTRVLELDSIGSDWGWNPMNNNIYNVREWMDYHEVVANDSRVLLGLSFLFLVVCLLSTITLLLTKFVGKKSETSLRRALGASRRIIFRQQIVEVAVIGFAGGLLGLLLTSFGLQGIQYLYDSPSGLVSLDWVIMSAAISIAIISSMIAGLYPAWRVCQVPPATQLKAQ